MCFLQNQAENMGHVISQHEVETNPKKIKAVVNWPTPQTLKSLRGFLALTGYYHKFIK